MPRSSPIGFADVDREALPEGNDDGHLAVLTERERDVLRLVMRGRTNREIAENLGLTEQTVKNHVSVLLQKLHARNRVELALIAMRRGRALGLAGDS